MSLLVRLRASATTTLSLATSIFALTGCALLSSASPASASRNQISIFEEPSIEDPGVPPAKIAQTLQTLRSLGVDMVRVGINWSAIAPNGNSRTRPNFNASDPNAYPAGAWQTYDRFLSYANQYGMRVDFIVGGPAPLWATQPGAPGCGMVGPAPVCYTNVWKPTASDYGQYIRAVGAHFRSVHFWELWNEANWGPSLAPQTQGGTIVAAGMYRSLLDAGYNGLRSSGHGRDTIAAGNYTQNGSAPPNATNSSAPVPFTRLLYCLNSSYRPLRGGAAQAVGCPTTNAGTRRFRGSHPSLFNITGFGVHPYQVFNPPTKADFPTKTGVEYSEIPNFLNVVDRLQRAYGSRKAMAVYNTEYGYQFPQPYGPPRAQATFANWLNLAEYIAWKNPRIGSYEQFGLVDPGWFKIGLISESGTPKLTFYAYRMPIWLPSTSQRRRGALEVWGDVRPAYFASSRRTAYIQWARGNSGQFRTIKAARTNSHGYFDVRVKFPSSGQVRIAWQYPPGSSSLYNSLAPSQTWIYSRTTSISVR
jgi:hypothetical protein